MPPIPVKFSNGVVTDLRPISVSAAVAIGIWIPLAQLSLLTPLATLAVSLATGVLAWVWWHSRVNLSHEDREDDKYPREYTREREYQGYDITVHVSEWFADDDRPYDVYRRIEATATDGETTIATEVSADYAGTLPVTVYDPSVGEGRNGTPAGQQTREVLEDLYDDILTYDATGSVEESAGVESALDVVFGESK